jgi:hypothetical protein
VLLVNGELVGTLRQRNLLHELEGLGVEHVDRLVLLVGAVVVETVRMDADIVGVRTTLDHADHLVDGRIDDVMRIAGVVALEDADGDPVIRIEARHPLPRHRRGQRDQPQGDRAQGNNAKRSTDECRHMDLR